MTLDELENYRVHKLNGDESKCREIESFVKSIKDAKIRSMIRMRCMSGQRTPSWQAVALRHGYLGEHTPKRKIEKYLSDVGNVGFDDV